MDILSTLFQQGSRRIGLMVPSVVVSEKHTDMLLSQKWHHTITIPAFSY